MARAAKSSESRSAKGSAAAVGFEAKVWLEAVKPRFGEMIDILIASKWKNIHESVDVLARIGDLFLTRFGNAECKIGRQFAIPPGLVRGLNALDLYKLAVDLLGKLFYRTIILGCPWIIGQNTRAGKRRAISVLELPFVT